MLTRAATSNLVLRGFSLSSAAQAGLSLQGVRHTAAQGNPAAVQSTRFVHHIQCTACVKQGWQQHHSTIGPIYCQCLACTWPLQLDESPPDNGMSVR